MPLRVVFDVFLLLHALAARNYSLRVPTECSRAMLVRHGQDGQDIRRSQLRHDQLSQARLRRPMLLLGMERCCGYFAASVTCRVQVHHAGASQITLAVRSVASETRARISFQVTFPLFFFYLFLQRLVLRCHTHLRRKGQHHGFQDSSSDVQFPFPARRCNEVSDSSVTSKHHCIFVKFSSGIPPPPTTPLFPLMLLECLKYGTRPRFRFLTA